MDKKIDFSMEKNVDFLMKGDDVLMKLRWHQTSRNLAGFITITILYRNWSTPSFKYEKSAADMNMPAVKKGDSFMKLHLVKTLGSKGIKCTVTFSNAISDGHN